MKEINPEDIKNLIERVKNNRFNLMEDEFGIYDGGFDADEMDSNALAAAMNDINNDGEEFVPLGQSEFERNLDTNKMKDDLSMTSLNLPSDKNSNRKMQQKFDKRYKHEKRFGVGSLNEGEKITKSDPLFNALQEAGFHPNIAPFGICIDINTPPYGDMMICFHYVILNTPGEKELIYTADIVHNSYEDSDNIVDKHVFFGDLHKALKFAEDEKTKWEKAEEQIPVIHVTPVEPQKGPRIVGKLDLPIDKKSKFKKKEIQEEDEHEEFNFDTSSLYKYIQDALWQLKWYDESEAAKILEKSLMRDWDIKPKNNSSISESAILRPKDATGQDITNNARVKHIETGVIGHVLHPGVGDNGEQTIWVTWMPNSTPSAQVPPKVVLPSEIVVDDDARIMREDEMEENSIHSHANGRGENLKPETFPGYFENDMHSLNEIFSHNEDERYEEPDYSGKKVVVKNLNELHSSTNYNQRKVDSILESVSESLNSNNIKKKGTSFIYVEGVDYLDKSWKFEIVGIDENNVYLKK